MSIFKSIASVFILLAFSIVIGLSIQAQQQPNRNNTRQIGNMLQRLERSSGRFRNSLNVALVQRSIDQTRPQNDISTFESGFQLAIKHFRDQFTRRLAVASDVENILQKASPINSFITQNTLNTRVRNDWASVRTELNTLANAYDVSWQWNQVTPMKVDANGSFRLSESELNQLIQRVENGGDAFRISLTDAFFRQPYDRTRSEGNMNDALRAFKKATNQLRSRFDVRQLETDDVRHLLDQATPLDNYMRANPLTDRARNDWSTLRTDLSVLASAFNVTPSWTSGGFIVRDVETLVAIMNNNLTTKLSQQGDLFTMTVRDPSQLEGAVIEGAVGSVDQGRRVAGRSGMSLNFERIRLRNGETYKFSGVLANVRLLNGDTVKVANGGSAQGTVFIQGKDNLELPNGTELTIRASGPR